MYAINHEKREKNTPFSHPMQQYTRKSIVIMVTRYYRVNTTVLYDRKIS